MDERQKLFDFSSYKQELDKIQHISCILFAFTLPLSSQVSVYTFFLLIISWILGGSFSFKLKRLANHRLVWLFSGLYLFQILGLLYSQNLNDGLFTLEKTSGLLMFPIILGSIKMNRTIVNGVYCAFVIGCAIAVVVCIANASLQLLFRGSDQFFLHHEFSSIIGLHAVYFSVYLVFSISLIWLAFLRKAFSTRSQRITAGLIMILFYLAVMLLASRIIIPFLIICSFLVASYVAIKRGKTKFLFLVLFILAASLFLLSRSPEIKGRFDSIGNFDFKYRVGNSNGVTQRLVVWKCCFSIWKENPVLGVGTGDAQGSLQQCYRKIGFQHGSGFHYNAHSQYFDVLIKFGAVGLGYFLAVLFIPLLVFRQYPLYVMFILILSTFFLSEVVLSRQQGILFYAFFNSFICFSNLELRMPSKR